MNAAQRNRIIERRFQTPNDPEPPAPATPAPSTAVPPALGTKSRESIHRRSRKSLPPSPPNKKVPCTSLERHSRLCAICRHDDRPEIEADFLHWHRSADIASDYALTSVNVLYRHVHATGLDKQRLKNMRSVAERILDKVEDVTPTANAIFKAMRILTHINDQGEWVDSVIRIMEPTEGQKSEAKVTQESFRVETAATATQQTTGAASTQ